MRDSTYCRRMRPVASVAAQKTKAQIRADLLGSGRCRVQREALIVAPEQWLALAHNVGVELGRTVSTTADSVQVAAVLHDWPGTDQERAAALGGRRWTEEAVTRLLELDVNWRDALDSSDEPPADP